MRIKLIVFLFVLAFLACMANISVLNPFTTPPSEVIPLLHNPLRLAQTGWAIASDANGSPSLHKTTDGGQTWTVQIQ